MCSSDLQLVVDPNAPLPNPILGHVTATCFSPTLGHPIALALLRNGRALTGKTFCAASPLAGQTVEVKVTGNVFLDPEGARVRG